jgi:hypothetical protein
MKEIKHINQQVNIISKKCEVIAICKRRWLNRRL